MSMVCLFIVGRNVGVSHTKKSQADVDRVWYRELLALVSLTSGTS